jgi:hypothetical protein
MHEISQPDSRLEQLEADVLARIAAFRESGSSRGIFPVGAIITVCALLAGLAIGMRHAQDAPLTGSETAVLAEDAGLAPSTLLVSAR